MAKKSTYKEEIADEICQLVSRGSTIAKLCRDPKYPCRATIYYWCNDHPEFYKKLQTAIELRADHWVDEIIQISEETDGDTIVSIDEQGNERRYPNTAKIQRDRLRVDTRKWAACKLYRRRYGDHQEIEHKGDIGKLQPILNVTIDGNKSALTSQAGSGAEDESE